MISADDLLLRRLRQGENSAYDMLYKSYFADIERMVLRNSGTKADAADIFQETILVLLHKVPQADFILTSSIRTYVNAIASNLWLKRLRDTRREAAFDETWDMADFSLTAWERQEDIRLRRGVLKRILRRITRHCLLFLTRTFISGTSREKLMAEMGYKNPHTFDNQKYKCLEQARRVSVPPHS